MTDTEVLSLAPLVGALERIWRVLQVRIPDLPAAAFIVGKGSRPGMLVRGSYEAERWLPRGAAVRDVGAVPYHEVFLAGERLADGPQGVLSTVLHEAAHALARARGLKETSNVGRYHNLKFKALAEELGLEVLARDKVLGWSNTHLPRETAERMAEELAVLDEAIQGFRLRDSDKFVRAHALAESGAPGQPTVRAETPRRPQRTRERYVCACSPPRVLYMAPGVWRRGGMRCEACGELFDTLSGGQPE